jgi:type IX secretion system PorP/SprF family membrane protein
MKKSLLLVLLAIVTLIGKAQQDPQLTMWQFDRVSFNPAASGMNGMHNVTLFHRDQWDGFEKDPKTYLFNYDGQFNQMTSTFTGGIGAGLSFFTEVLGQQQNNVFRLNLAPKFALSGGSTLGIGLALGAYQSKLGANWIYIDQNDPTIPDKEQVSGVFDLGFGLTLYRPGQYYVGASATHLTASEFKNLSMNQARHYYFMGGYEYALPSANIVLRPNALIKTDFNATQFDINIDALWNQMLWGGLAFRPGDAIAPYVGFQKNFTPMKWSPTSELCEHGIKIGYSYDVTTSEIKTYSSGSHEIFLTYSFKFCPIVIKAKNHNPRFL